MPTIATAVFGDRHSAHAAVEQLVQAGFPRDALSVVVSEDTFAREFGGPGAASGEKSGIIPVRPAGVLTALVGGLVSVAAPGGPPIRATGPLFPSLHENPGDAQATLSARLVQAGVPDLEARALVESLGTGGMVVGVHASEERARLATRLLELAGGRVSRAA